MSTSQQIGSAPPRQAAHPLEDQARLAWVEYRRHRQELIDRGEELPKLSRRRVKIPHWTVAAARQVLGYRDPQAIEPDEKATGGHMMAAVLSQMLYWLVGVDKQGRPRAHAPVPDRRLDHPWFATTAAELAGQIGAKARQVEYCMSSLRDAGWIGYHPMRYRGRGNLRGLVVSHVWLGTQTRQMLTTICSAGGKAPAISLLRWSMLAAGGDINAALLLSQLWHRAGGVTKHGQPVSRRCGPEGGVGDVTLKINNDDLAEWLLLSPTQLKRARAKLRELNLVLPATRGHVRLNVRLCQRIWVLAEWSPNVSESSWQVLDRQPNAHNLHDGGD